MAGIRIGSLYYPIRTITAAMVAPITAHTTIMTIIIPIIDPSMSWMMIQSLLKAENSVVMRSIQGGETGLSSQMAI